MPKVSYAGLRPASPRATKAARSSSRKQDTRCELLLRKQLAARHLRYRINAELVGRPDIVFHASRVVVFCDGDYWHGRDIEHRLAKLKTGHNAAYWVAKITSNVERDRRVTAALEDEGWLVLRFWETDIKRDAMRIADEIAVHVRTRRPLPA
jgi:DNA mismatch endonuclease (patch repair protein)